MSHSQCNRVEGPGREPKAAHRGSPVSTGESRASRADAGAQNDAKKTTSDARQFVKSAPLPPAGFRCYLSWKVQISRAWRWATARGKEREHAAADGGYRGDDTESTGARVCRLRQKGSLSAQQYQGDRLLLRLWHTD